VVRHLGEQGDPLRGSPREVDPRGVREPGRQAHCQRGR